MVYLLAQLTCRAGSHPESTEAAKAMITATRAEPGCILYDLNISITDARRNGRPQTRRRSLKLPRLARRWRGAVSGVVCQIRIVGIVHFPLVTRIKSLRTPNKSGLWPEVNGWWDLAQSGS